MERFNSKEWISTFGAGREPTDFIRYSRNTGFGGITSEDKELWLSKYPHVSDVDLNVREAAGWLSDSYLLRTDAEQQPRRYLEWWLEGDWERLVQGSHSKPEEVCNPEQLKAFIEEYFKNADLIKRVIRGKRDGFSESLAKRHYDKALGHAVRLRNTAPDFQPTPPATGDPIIDLRKLQEWCVECQKIADSLLARITVQDIDKALSPLRELDGHLKSGFPQADPAALGELYSRVWGDIERLVKAIDEIAAPNAMSFASLTTPTTALASKVERWLYSITLGGDHGALKEKMREHGISVPGEDELRDMLDAAEWMAKTNWDQVRAIVEKRNGEHVAHTPIEDLTRRTDILFPAQITEERVRVLAWRRYRRENQDFDKAQGEAEGRVASLYNEAAQAVNSHPILVTLVHLRGDKLQSSVKRLHDALFEKSVYQTKPDEPLRETIRELEAIRESVEDAPKADDVGSPVGASIGSDRVVDTPTIEEISEVIEKLVTAKQQIEKIKDVAENGEDPQKAEEELEKAVQSLRELRNTLAANRPSGPIEVPEDVQVGIDALRESGAFPGWAEVHVIAMERVARIYRDLPIAMLRRLRTQEIHKIWQRDSQRVSAGLTLGELKSGIEVLETSKELELVRRVREETERVLQDVDLILCPYQDFLRQEPSSGVLPAGASPLDVAIHKHKRIKRRLEVKARRQEAEQRNEKQIERQVTKRSAKAIGNKTTKKFRPWPKPGDACFIIDGNRMLFHHDDEIKDLRLKGHSKTQTLLVMLQGGALQSHDIKTNVCSKKTKPIQVVSRANQQLNDSIRKVGFTCLPDDNVEFIRYHREFDHYKSDLRIHASEADFDRATENDQ